MKQYIIIALKNIVFLTLTSTAMIFILLFDVWIGLSLMIFYLILNLVMWLMTERKFKELDEKYDIQ